MKLKEFLQKTIKTTINGMISEDTQLDQAFNDAKPVEESVMSELDLLAREARDLKSFIKTVYKEFDNLPKSKDTLKWLEDIYLSVTTDEHIEESAKRDYKKEYEKYGKSEKAKKYRAELNKYNRDKGTYGNGDGKDASHKGGKIVGFEDESKNRGRAEKSRLKKEATFVPNSGTMSGGVLQLDNRKYQLKKDVKGVKIGNNIVTLPKGTILYNIAGGLFADHKSLEQYADRNRQYFKKPTFNGIQITQKTDTIKDIDKNSKVLESINEAKLARGLKPLLTMGSKITKKTGEEALIKLSDKFDRIDDEDADNIASHLNMAIELMQDGYGKSATEKLKQFNKACKDALAGKEVGSAFESVNERADYKYLTQVILDAKPKYDVYYNSSHNVVNIGGVGYDKGDLVKNFNQKPGSSTKIKNNFYHAHQDPQKTKIEVEKLSKGKIKVKVGNGGFLSYSLKESVVTEAKDNLYLQLHKKYAEQIKGLKAKKIKKLTDLVWVQRSSMEDRDDYFDMNPKKKKELSAEYKIERALLKKYMGGNYSVMLPKGTEKLSESVNEARSKKVTKQMWAKMDDDKRIDALLSVVKDPDEAEKYFDKKWNDLPSGFERDMTIYESVNEEQIDEKLITFSNRAPYGQIVFMAGGAGSGKGFAIDNFIDSAGFKVRDVDEMKKSVGKLDQLGKFSVDKWYKKYGKKLSDKPGKSGGLSPKAHVEEFVLGKGMSISDISKDLKNPNNVASLHYIVDSMGLKDKWVISMLSGKDNKETLPNLLFDITAKKVSSITEVIKPMINAGYDVKNIHLIWVLANFHVAIQANKDRDRMVPEDILLQTHEGAGKTMWEIMTKILPKGLNGRIDVILNKRAETVPYVDSNGKPIMVQPNQKNKLEDAQIVVKGFTSLPIKKQGGGVQPEKAWKEILKTWILNNAPKTIDLSQQIEEGNNDYFKTAGEAVEFAKKAAEKKGFDIDEDDWNSQITMGGKYNRLRPGVGKTHSFQIGLLKKGKPQKKGLAISLYGMDSGKYELTHYIN